MRTEPIILQPQPDRRGPETTRMRARLMDLEQHHSDRERFLVLHRAAWRQGCRYGIKRGLQFGALLGTCTGAALIMAALQLGRWMGA